MNKTTFIYLLVSFILFACENEGKNVRKHNLEGEIEIVTPKGSERPQVFSGNHEFKNRTANSLNSQGMSFIRNGEYLNAEKKFIEALKYESDNPTILNNLGNLTKDFGDTNRAIEYYKKAIEFSDSTYFSSVYNLGLTYCNSKRYDDSEEILKYVLKNFDNENQQSITSFTLAKVYLGLNDCTNAERFMEKAEYFYTINPQITSKIETLKEEIRTCFKNTQLEKQ